MEKYLIIDTETANNLDYPLVYDIGYQVVDRKGTIYERGAYLVKEIFVQSKDLMETAYYAKKIPEYWERVWNKEITIKRFSEIRTIIRNTLKKWNIKKVGAYNAAFDRKALDVTTRLLYGSSIRYFFPYGVEWFCIWHMATQTLLSQNRFKKMAMEEGWLSAKGNLLTNAEVCYRYLIGGHDFDEEHKALDDVVIESFIFEKVLAQHRKVDWSIKRGCWRIPQTDRVFPKRKEITA